MKVIKPIEEVRDTYTDVNTRDIVPAWSYSTAYGASSTFDKVWVQYQGTIYESIKPNNQQLPSSISSTWWRTVTTLAADDFAIEVWSAATTYAVGQIVYYQTSATAWPKYYQSLQNSNLNKIPPDNLIGTTPFWLDLGYTNTSKLYDIETNTQTITTDELITTFTARKCTSGGIFGAQGNRVLLTAKSERNLYSQTDWTSVNLNEAAAPQLRAMVFAPDKNILVLCGRNGYLKYSKDNGNTWNSCTLPTGPTDPLNPHLLSLAYNRTNSIFVAVGTRNDLGGAVVFKSTDGITWANVSSISSLSTSINKVIWVKELNQFLAAGSNGYLHLSDSGLASNWTARSVGVGTSDLVGIVYNPANGVTHVVGNQILRYSGDLNTWNTVAVTQNIKTISLFNTVSETGVSSYEYGYIGDVSGQGVLVTSTNGTTWTSRGPIGQNSSTTDLYYCYTENKWIILGTSSSVAQVYARNTTDAQYSIVTPSQQSFDTSFIRVFYNQSTDTIFIFGNNNKIITSPNIYFQEYSLNTALVDNWYDYFYKDYAILTEAIFENVPVYTRTRITVCVVGDIVRCGIAFAGVSTRIGTTQYGASAGIIDYSKKETDEFGTTTFVKRAFSKRMNVNLILPSADLYRVQKTLSDVRATPCVWIGSDSDIYKSLTMYGYYKDFSLEIPYPEYSYCSLQVEGLTE